MIGSGELRKHFLVVIAVLLLGAPVSATDVRGTFTFEGVLKDSASPPNPILATDVTFTVRILDPTGTACVLYEEVHTLVDVSTTEGQFALIVGDTSQANVAAGPGHPAGNTIKQVFDNSLGSITGTNGGTCPGLTYAPATTHHRNIQIVVDSVAPNLPAENLPVFAMNTAPHATYAEMVGGRRAGDLIQVNTGGANVLSQTNVQTVFSTPNYTELLALLGGTSSNYMSSTPVSAQNFNGQVIDNIAAPVDGNDAVNMTYADGNLAGNAIAAPAAPQTNMVLKWTGTAWVYEEMLPITGGTLTGALTLNGDLTMAGGSTQIDVADRNVTNTGFITMNPDRYLHLGRYDDTAENALVTGTPLAAAHEGVMWFDEEDNTIEYWDGAAVQVLGSGGGGATNINGLTDAVANATSVGLGPGAGIAGTNNTAVGLNALNVLVTAGDDNVAIGKDAIGAPASGTINRNTVVGAGAGTSLNGGDNNIMLGFGTGSQLTSGSFNTLIGNDVELPAGTINNMLNIGNFVYGTGLNTVGNATDPDARIGLGVVTPQRILHLHDPGGGNEIGMQITNTDTTSSANQGAFVGVSVNEDMLLWNYENTRLIFGANNTEHMTVREGGEVGIGTPAPSALLHVARTTGIVAKFEKAQADDNFMPALQLYRSRFDATQPAAGFGAELQFRLEGSANNSEVDAGGVGLRWENNQVDATLARDSSLDFATMLNNVKAVRMTLDSEGRLGIGNQTPAARLEVANASALDFRILATGANNADMMVETADNQNGLITFQESDPNFGFRFLHNGTANDFQIQRISSGTAFPSIALLRDADRVGIFDDTPDAELEVSGAFMVSSSPAGDGDRFIVTGTGAVGIADTTPDAGLLLDVEGNIGANNFCDAAGGNCSTAAELAGVVGGSVINGGNSGALTIGTNDGTTLFIETNNTIGMQMDGVQNVLMFGSLNVNGMMTSNPSGTGAGQAGEIRMQELAANGTNHIGFRSPDSLAADLVYVMPTAPGSTGQFLTSTVAGAMSWVTVGLDDLSEAAVNGTNSFFIGNNAGAGNTGTRNLGIGANSLDATVTGFDNVAIGFDAMTNNAGGGFSVAVGAHALSENTNGTFNTAVGDDAIRFNENGRDNVAVGKDALRGIATNSQNRNVVVGALAGDVMEAADDNVIIGFDAGDSITSGDNNILIGSGVDVITGTDSNKINIGNTLFGDTALNRIGIGTPLPSVSFEVAGTDAIRVPQGTTAQRPANADGLIRFNTTTRKNEAFEDGNWKDLVHEVVAVRYRMTTVQALSGGATEERINFNTQLFDDNGDVTNPATNWEFVAPVDGYYQVSAKIGLLTSVSGIACDLALYWGPSGSEERTVLDASASEEDFFFQGSTLVRLDAGDILYLTFLKGSGPAVNTDVSDNWNWVSVHRVGN